MKRTLIRAAAASTIAAGFALPALASPAGAESKPLLGGLLETNDDPLGLGINLPLGDQTLTVNVDTGNLEELVVIGLKPTAPTPTPDPEPQPDPKPEPKPVPPPRPTPPPPPKPAPTPEPDKTIGVIETDDGGTVLGLVGYPDDTDEAEGTDNDGSDASDSDEVALPAPATPVISEPGSGGVDGSTGVFDDTNDDGSDEFAASDSVDFAPAGLGGLEVEDYPFLLVMAAIALIAGNSAAHALWRIDRKLARTRR